MGGELLKDFDGQLPTRLWVAPPTKMDAAQLTAEGYYSVYGKVGARTEMPGCSLCMGNQARVADKATVVSTSTRNFPNRLGQARTSTSPALSSPPFLPSWASCRPRRSILSCIAHW